MTDMTDENKSLITVPPIHYFEEGNKYSGSAHKIFRYKITPDGELSCIVWHKDLASDCISLEDIKAQASFELSAQGREELVSWLEERLADFTDEHSEELHRAHADI